MKPLVINQKVLTWLFLLPHNENTSKWTKCASVALVVTLIVAVFTIFPSSLLYILKFMTIDGLEVCVGIRQATATIPMANSIVVAFLRRHKIPPVYEKLSEFYDKCMN